MEKVTISNYKLIQSKEGREFWMVELSQGIELAVSKSNNPYLTARKCWISTNFDELGCKSAIGLTLSGSIVKESCNESYVNASGDTITLNHKYVYCPNEVSEENVPKEKLEMA